MLALTVRGLPHPCGGGLSFTSPVLILRARPTITAFSKHKPAFKRPSATITCRLGREPVPVTSFQHGLCTSKVVMGASFKLTISSCAGMTLCVRIGPVGDGGSASSPYARHISS